MNADPRKLFRKEALERSGERLHGEIFLATTRHHKIALALFLAFVASFILFFTQFSYSRKITAQGVIAPPLGSLRISAPQQGTLARIHVEQGALVKPGDPLFTITDQRLAANGSDSLQSIETFAKSRQSSLEADKANAAALATQKLAQIDARLTQLSTEAASLAQQRKLAISRAVLAASALAQNEKLADSGFISPAQIQSKQSELLDAQGRLAEIDRAIANNQSESTIARAGKSEQALQNRRDAAALERSASSAAQDLAELSARREVLIKSPIAGIIGALPLRQGQLVAAGAFLASINSTSEKHVVSAEIALPSSAIGFVKPGTPVYLRYQAFPYQKFGQHLGHISDISPTLVLPADSSLPSAGRTEPFFPARIALEQQNVKAFGQERPLLPGMAFDATLVLESRTLAEWIFEPLYTISGRSAPTRP